MLPRSFVPEVVDLTDDATRLEAKLKVRDISDDQARERATKEALVAMVKSTFLDACNLDVDICPSGNKKLPGTEKQLMGSLHLSMTLLLPCIP
jgi:hypothetical protein